VTVQARDHIEDQTYKKFESGQYSHIKKADRRIIQVKYITIQNPEDWEILKDEAFMKEQGKGQGDDTVGFEDENDETAAALEKDILDVIRLFAEAKSEDDKTVMVNIQKQDIRVDP